MTYSHRSDPLPSTPPPFFFVLYFAFVVTLVSFISGQAYHMSSTREAKAPTTFAKQKNNIVLTPKQWVSCQHLKKMLATCSCFPFFQKKSHPPSKPKPSRLVDWPVKFPVFPAATSFLSLFPAHVFLGEDERSASGPANTLPCYPWAFRRPVSILVADCYVPNQKYSSVLQGFVSVIMGHSPTGGMDDLCLQ